MSSDEAGGSQGILRGVVLAGTTSLLTAAGHLAGGGTIPSLALLILLFPLLTGVFVAIARHVAGVAGTVVRLAAGQVVLHYLMVLMHPTHAVADPMAMSSWRMLGMHAAVTVATAVAVRHADAAMLAVGAVLRRVVPRRLVLPAVQCPLPRVVVPEPAVPAHLARALSVAHIRRGPPVGSSALQH
ncbi:hypothetical protein [Pseudonocardia alaniniphila]|uniref:Integral membrane protein n=1 Tax=Pseudonocardia alaniniphila TaxID=75291 RepID=A0ABS9TSN2_9PSEU|nr:hypothetical protein [Pseudonocardia alaniniphila]MCH6171433.1 hypothetical protein [Pseudonocardia alaniniphila]